MQPKVTKPTLSVLFSIDTFISPYREHFSNKFQLNWSSIPFTPPPKRAFDFLTFPFKLTSKKIKTFFSSRGTDIIFVEFTDETLALVSKLRKEKMIVTRLHRYELFNLPSADWSAVDLVIVVNNWMGKNLEQKVPSLKGKIVCIPNFVDTNYWHKSENRLVNNQLSLVGNIEERKGHDKAITAFSKILEKNKNLRLNIIGKSKDQSFSDKLNSLVLDLGLSDNVKFKGYVEDLRHEFHKTDIILSFSKHESTHLTLFEGLSCGAFPLSRNWEGVEEFLPSSNIFTDDSDFADKVLSFYNKKEKERFEIIDNLAASTLPRFSSPDPREVMSDIILKKYLELKN